MTMETLQSKNNVKKAVSIDFGYDIYIYLEYQLGNLIQVCKWNKGDGKF